MDLVQEFKEYEINGEDFILCFDMRSIPIFKKITGMSFIQGSKLLGELDDTVMLGFLAATLRKKEAPKEPLGYEIYNYNILGLLIIFNGDVLDIVTSSVPQVSKDKKNSKKKIIQIGKMI